MSLVVLGTALALSGCAGGPATTPQPSTTAVEAAETSAAVPAAQRVASTAAGWFAGAELTLTAASFDPATGTAQVAASARNTSNQDLEILDDVFLDLGAGAAPLPLSGIGPTAPHDATSDVAFRFAVPAGTAVDLATASLQLGDVDQQRWTLPLAPGATGTGIEPRSTDVHDTFSATGYAFTISRIDVVPWGCAEVNVDGGVGTTDYAPIAKGRLGLLVWMTYTERAAYPGGDTIEEVDITQPDGTTVRADPRTLVQGRGDRVEDIPWCIAADEPVGGDYRLRWRTHESGTGSHVVTVR